MSNTANWSYTNVATVRPFLSKDKFGSPSYGPEYEIACTWTAIGQQRRLPSIDGGGQEFIAQQEVFTEDTRPKYLDQIRFDHSNGWQTIKHVTSWDMSPFDEAPDFKLTT